MAATAEAPSAGPLPAQTAVILPGTGSDEVFVRAAFERPLASIGAELLAPAPARTGAIAEHYLAALDAEAERSATPLLVGGVSFGAHLAALWAMRNPPRCSGLLLALPAWNGDAGSGSPAPAALAALASARQVRTLGVERALQVATAGVPGWLAEELTRSWRGHSNRLADGLEEAAGHPAPELAALGSLDLPAGLVACTDDPLHPAEVAYAWADALSRAAVAETSLAAIGADRSCLGRACIAALQQARALPVTADVAARYAEPSPRGA